MITINTFLAECSPAENEEELLIAQLTENTFFNIEDDEQLEKCRSSLSSHLVIYTSGYIEIAQYGETFMDQRQWDYALWLWMVISDSLESVIYRNTASETLFPDQPLYLLMTPRKNNILLEIKDKNKTHKSVLYPRTEFLMAFVAAGIDVFTRILKYNSSQRFKDVLEKFGNYQEILSL